ncbi:MAG: ferredoxin [Candidatus Margulisbacteria bacterium]|nr:ferredoxin [Candidatus Margulisiibacteriota bacterium]MBU1022168.1 ferredoxin [Candidatus Margulisiibacteriota bacterium]MBU1729393.1 ferredoxin [Candidatus Margulisiibacteriota bacterium]MBU1955666.1 ferredoxin [Candidatus Margulisiibacteriota bacterium]
MIKNEKDFNEEVIIAVAQKMCLAARTAPKARGVDNLEIIIVTDKDILKLSAKMKEIGEREQHQTFIRDAENIKNAKCLVVIGTKTKYLGLKYCKFCGFANCAEAEKNNAICVFNTGDLGIAMGSAVAIAADNRVDNRIMYTIGRAAIDAGFFDKGVAVAFGIPLSVSGKNPFFDRK